MSSVVLRLSFLETRCYCPGLRRAASGREGGSMASPPVDLTLQIRQRWIWHPVSPSAEKSLCASCSAGETVYQHAHPCENKAPVILPRSVYPGVMCYVTVSEIKVASGFLKFMNLNRTNFSLEGEKENIYLGNTN